MFNEKITIIVPIFNSERYLDKCIQSILVQSYNNLEIILVNDGSTDNSFEICEKYASKDKRIIILNKKNGGSSDARNFGLDNSSGNYITFCDSDDTIEPDSVNQLYKTIKSNKTTCAEMGVDFIRLNSRKEKHNPILPENKVYTNLEFIENLLTHKSNSSVCNKLFEKSIINTNRFIIGIKNEDIVFLVELAKSSLFTISTTNFIGYNYIQRENSVTNSVTNSNNKSFIDQVYNSKRIIHLIKPFGINKQIIENYELFCLYGYFATIDYSSRKTLHFQENKEDLKSLRHAINKSNYNFFQKSVLLCASINPYVTVFSLNKLKFIKRFLSRCIRT